MKIATLDLRTVSESDCSSWFSECSAERQASILRFIRKEDQRRSICADHLARTMLSEVLCCDPRDLIFEKEPGGKPFLKDGACCFNLSHSGNYIACMISALPVGVDIEYIRPVSPALIHHICSPAEAEFVLHSPDRVYENFFRIWTAKEAWLKMTGEGIHFDMKRFEVLSGDTIVIPNASVTQQYCADYVLTGAEKKN